MAWQRTHLAKTILLWVGITSGWTASVHAQEDSAALADEYYRMGMEIFDFTHRKQATELFTLATQMNPRSAKAHFMTGKSIMLTIRKEQSLPYFKRAQRLDPAVDKDILYYLGQAYQYSELLDSAKTKYTDYLSLTESTTDSLQLVRRAEVKRKLLECDQAKIFMASPANVDIVHVSNKVNSEYPDYAPTVTADESLLVFTSRRQDGNLNPKLAADLEYYEDIYVAYRKNGEWQEAKNIGPPLNDRYHNASVNLSPDGKEMFIYHDEYGGDIFVSYQKPDGTWTAPEPLQEINTPFAENSASITANNQKLFFTSNRPPGMGGTDIYQATCTRQGKWGNIKNLGPVVNTPYDEDGAFIAANGQHLYFSSNGHIGMGDLDIFRSSYDSLTDSWSEPVNLGYPINSTENDIYFALTGDERYAYFSSVKFQNHGEQDIYRADMRFWKPVTYAERVKIYEQKKQQDSLSRLAPDTTIMAPVMAPAVVYFVVDLTVADAATQQPLVSEVDLGSEAGPMTRVHNVGPGQFRIESAPGFSIVARSDGYLPSARKSFVFDGMNTSVRTDTILLERIQRDIPQILNIYFNFDSDIPNSYSEVDRLAALLAASKHLRVIIAGHTDDIGNDAYNQQLSERRANRVRGYLVDKGIDPARVDAIGYGKTNPLVPNKTKASRRYNRRTEFTIK